MAADTNNAHTLSWGIRPLAGTEIVTTALNVPGPLAAQRLCLLGAHVTKIEPPEGDPLRSFSPRWYAELTEGMIVEECDLKTAAGRTRLAELLARADLLLTAQRPATLRRLELAWEALHARFPRLCQVAIVGYPPPYQDRAGHDLTYLAAYGLLQPPALPITLSADLLGSEQAALAALAVLRERDRGGVGLYLEVALANAAKRLAAPLAAGLTASGGPLAGGFPGYHLYATKDGWVAVAALEPRFYRRLCEQLGVGVPSYEAFAACFAAEPNAYWASFARAHDLPIAVVEQPAPGR